MNTDELEALSMTEMDRRVRMRLRDAGVRGAGLLRMAGEVTGAGHTVARVAWDFGDRWRAFTGGDFLALDGFDGVGDSALYEAMRDAAAMVATNTMRLLRAAHRTPTQRPEAAPTAPEGDADGPACVPASSAPAAGPGAPARVVYAHAVAHTDVESRSIRTGIGRAWENADGSLTVQLSALPSGLVTIAPPPARVALLSEVTRLREAAADAERTRDALQRATAALVDAEHALEAERREAARLRELVLRLTDENDAARNALASAARERGDVSGEWIEGRDG